MKDKQCEVEGCNNVARYALYKTYPNGEKKWLHVCTECEKQIGMENLKRAKNET